MNKTIKLLAVACFPAVMLAQSAKVQTAYRNLQDYETSKDVASLMSAKEAIDMASNNEDTKGKAKTWVYRAKVYYALFKNDFDQTEKKLTTVTDKNEKATQAYGNVPTANYEEATKAVEKAINLDKDKTYQADISMLGMQMMNDVNNLAVGKYNVKKYGEAISYFEASYVATKALGKKDTSALTNCLICAQKSKDAEKIKLYDQKMIDEKVATVYNYNNLYDVKMDTKDTTGAMQTLQAGLTAYPNNEELLKRQTDNLINSGKKQEAIATLDKVIEKNPKDAKLVTTRGFLFYTLANPTDAKTKKDLDKPKNYDELMGKAEQDYKKATTIDPKYYDCWFDLGVLYNNWSLDWQKRCDDLIKQAVKLKECEAKSNELIGKAVPAFEGALAADPNDKASMQSLSRLYLLTNQPDKAQKMRDMMKK